jgi:hyperosmotically inducible protein
MERVLTPAYSYIFMFVLGISTVFAQQPTSRTQERGAGSQDRVRAYLVKEVRHELAMLPYYSVFDWLQFEVQADGDVILLGQVTRPTLKSDAENVVKDIEGVTKVDNRIEVLPLSPNDDRIRRAAYQALFNFNSPIYRYGMGAIPSIHIIVKNGNLTLKGIVDSEGEKNLANVRVNGLSGVFSVRNELVVASGGKNARRD